MSENPNQNASTNAGQGREIQQRTPIAAGERGLMLRSLDDYWRMATWISESGFAPSNMQKPAAILVALQMGAELGLSPMASMQNIAVINGRPSVWGDAQLAIVRASGHFDEEAFDEHYTGEYPKEDFTAICIVKRKGSKREVIGEFSIADAKRAGLWAKQGPWSQYPKRMLKWRARGYALRDAFTDLLRGFITVEEAEDMPPRHVESRVVTSADMPRNRAESLVEQIKAQGDASQIAPIPVERQAYDARQAEESINAAAQQQQGEKLWPNDAPENAAQEASEAKPQTEAKQQSAPTGRGMRKRNQFID